MPPFCQSLKPESENDMPTSTDSVGPDEPLRHSIGALLRETRQGFGGDIERIAATLRIRAAYLKAIEESQYDCLPAQVYALGFVRAYANHLGLDGEEAVRRFKQETVDFEPPRGLSFPVPLVERSIPGGRMLLAALIFALCGYGLWYYVSTGERARPERVSAVPPDLAPPPLPAAPASPPTANAPESAAPASQPAVAPAPAEAAPGAPASVPPAPTRAEAPAPPAATAVAPPADIASTPTAPASETPPASEAVKTAPAQASAVAASSASPAPPAATAPGTTTPAAATPAVAATSAMAAPEASQGRAYGAVDEPSRIVIEVRKDSWLQIHDGDRLLLDKVLHPGDSYRVGDRVGLVMRTGNAAGLDIEVDGHKAPPIKGTVRNQILLDANRLLAGTASAD